LTDHQGAGLIDNQMNVAIRACRLLIADLSHGNQGAYWEAGFAYGLGKPVIYTCDASRFEDTKTHFDTNHHVTIKWKLDDLPAAGTELTALIRNTLPADAKN
jgi:nucleoside 2-deoxyribosyltransferase